VGVSLYRLLVTDHNGRRILEKLPNPLVYAWRGSSSHEITLQAFDRGILPSYPLARLSAHSRGSRLASTDYQVLTGTGDRYRASSK
jgi:hypothetical protein